MADGLHLAIDDAGVHVVRGELDAHSADAFEAATATASGAVSMDLGGVAFADSSGLRVLLALHRRLEEDGGELRIVSASDRVQRLLGLTGLDQVLRID
ncbi:MAG: STAS domain-containing protein [Actinomycetota bacterium]